MITLDKLKEQLQTYDQKMNEAFCMAHQLLGAVNVVKLQIQALEMNENEKDSQNEQI